MRSIPTRPLPLGPSTGCELPLMWADALGRAKSLLYEWLPLVRERVWESCLAKARQSLLWHRYDEQSSCMYVNTYLEVGAEVRIPEQDMGQWLSEAQVLALMKNNKLSKGNVSLASRVVFKSLLSFLDWGNSPILISFPGIYELHWKESLASTSIPSMQGGQELGCTQGGSVDHSNGKAAPHQGGDVLQAKVGVLGQDGPAPSQGAGEKKARAAWHAQGTTGASTQRWMVIGKKGKLVEPPCQEDSPMDEQDAGLEAGTGSDPVQVAAEVEDVSMTDQSCIKRRRGEAVCFIQASRLRDE